MERVFVYGTLRRGERNHRLLGGAPYLGAHVTEPTYTMLDLGAYPAVVPGGAQSIVGEVYALSRARLRVLDRLEDCPREYTREPISTPYGPAWVYLYRQLPRRVRTVSGGDWSRRGSALP